MNSIKEVLTDIVLSVRQKLSNQYDIVNEYPNYSGLCDLAYEIFKEEINFMITSTRVEIEILRFHGEQKHRMTTRVSQWPAEHTWMGVRYRGETWYVDPTSQQFNYLYDDIPDYYISIEPPRWYYWDRKNPRWNGITKWLNDKIVIRYKIKRKGKKEMVKDGIIEFLQYEMWGDICRMYQKLIRALYKFLSKKQVSLEYYLKGPLFTWKQKE